MFRATLVHIISIPRICAIPKPLILCDSRMSSYATIKDRLELEIQEHGFVTPGKLPQLCSTGDIRLLLGLNHLDRRPQDIFASSLKIFSILVLLDQPSVILECLDPGLNDEWAFKTFQQQPFFKDGDLRGTVLEPFGGLLHKQWVFPPPLSRDIHYEFPPAFLDALPKKDKRKIGRGNYGTIYKHHFQKGQLKDYPNVCEFHHIGTFSQKIY